ncbi:MAG: polysaccharide biosynthesis polyprenyl glycosylphosphotransferase [Mucilaginibacter sp.]|nr:polysaccharide biosynthesis polyprenyl glycosylphosphotransferase [Mucilaginibacter sp.]
MVEKRVFDFCFALIGLICLTPLFIVIACIIRLDSRGNIFYVQRRIGRNGIEFLLYKFRTMYVHSEQLGLLTIGYRDYRITHIGYWLRRYKLDELPQLFNILIGNMSFVGPRPEVRKYVETYTKQQQRVLLIKPGITDWASILYYNENEILAKSENPEYLYINEIIPTKILQNLNYIDRHNLWIDLRIIFQTLKKVINK